MDIEVIIEKFNETLSKCNENTEKFNLEREIVHKNITDELSQLYISYKYLSEEMASMKDTLTKNTLLLEKIAIDVEDTNKIKTQGKAYYNVGKFLIWVLGGALALGGAIVSFWNTIKEHIK